MTDSYLAPADELVEISVFDQLPKFCQESWHICAHFGDGVHRTFCPSSAFQFQQRSKWLRQKTAIYDPSRIPGASIAGQMILTFDWRTEVQSKMKINCEFRNFHCTASENVQDVLVEMALLFPVRSQLPLG